MDEDAGLQCFGMRWENEKFRVTQEDEKQVCMVRENLRVTQSRQKSYSDHSRRELSFEVGDFVYLKVSPMRGLRRFKVRGPASSLVSRPSITEPRVILEIEFVNNS
jgi:hypothetical protein